MSEFIPVFLQSISIVLLVEIVAMMILTMIKYFKTMKTPPFWIYICGGFILLSLYDMLFVGYSKFTIEEIPIAIIKVMAYFLVLLGVFKLHRIMTESNI